MKKIVCLFLVLVLVFSLCVTVYADPIEDEVYGTEEIEDEDVAGAEAEAGGEIENNTETVVDEATAGGDAKLPKTGGIPAELFYAVGALLIASALLITVKKKKASAKG